MLSGYTASNSIEIRTTDIDSVGEIIDIAFAAGANELNAVNFSASNAGEAQQQALALAVENAMTKAQTLADAAGVGIGEVLSLEEQPSYGAATGAAYLNLREESAADAGDPRAGEHHRGQRDGGPAAGDGHGRLTPARRGNFLRPIARGQTG